MSTAGWLTGQSERRTAEQRAEARSHGVDRYGRPTPRALGVSPRQLRKLHPELSKGDARLLSATLTRKAHQAFQRARGAAPTPEGFPSSEAVSSAEGAYPAGVDSGSVEGQAVDG